MIDFINDDENANHIAPDEEDFISHIENLWQTHGGGGGGGGGLGGGGHGSQIVLGHQLGGLGGGSGRNYQINILGGGANLSIAPSIEPFAFPSHPLSVSAVHPLLVHNTDSTGTGTAVPAPSAIGSSANPFQITGLGNLRLYFNQVFTYLNYYLTQKLFVILRI